MSLTKGLLTEFEDFMDRVESNRPMETDVQRLLHAVFLAGMVSGTRRMVDASENAAVAIMGVAQYRLKRELQRVVENAPEEPVPVEPACPSCDSLLRFSPSCHLDHEALLKEWDNAHGVGEQGRYQ